MKNAMFALCLMAVLSACGKSNTSSDDQIGSSMRKKYQFIVNGCDTGEHEFDSMTTYCAGLKDDKLNRSCAETTRRDTYREDCTMYGSFDS